MCLFREGLSIGVRTSFPSGFEGEMLDLIVLVPAHCLLLHYSNLVQAAKYHGFIST